MMRKFTIYLLKVFILFMFLLVILDVMYTAMFYQVKSINKFYWVRNMTQQQLDYAVFGSSRVKYHINADQINKETGLKGYNFGESDQGLNEIYLMIKTFFANNNSVKQVFVQLDDNWNDEEPNILASSFIMPFIREKIYKNHYQHYGNTYKFYVYVPFIRYMYNSHTIGFRELLNILFDDKNETSDFGFKSLDGKIAPSLIHKASFIPKSNNELIKKISRLVVENGADIRFFTAPTLEYNPDQFSKFEGEVPNYTNFMNNMDLYNLDDFWDNIHLNKAGTKIFMRQFIDCYFTNKNGSYAKVTDIHTGSKK